MNLSRRNFVKMAGLTAAGAALDSILPQATPAEAAGKRIKLASQAPVVASRLVTEGAANGSVAKVYFTRHLDAKHLISMYDRINEGIYGNVALKLHTGEPNGPYILPVDWIKEFQQHVPHSTICDTNTLYVFGRDTTEKNHETQKLNGWTFSRVDILDEDGGVDLPVRGGKVLDHVTMGSHITNYDSMVVLTHFKGHAMGGYGGSLKNIAIGNASGQVGKRQVHGYFDTNPPDGIHWGVLKEGFMDEVDAFTGGRGFDYVFETAGNTITMKMAFRLAANRAHVCFIGTPKKDLTFAVPEWEMMNRKEFILTGSWMSYSAPFPGHEWDDVAHYFATGQLKYDPRMIWKIVPLSRLAEAFAWYKEPGKVKGKILVDSEA